MLTTVDYPGAAGINNEWDAVELPSQFMETGAIIAKLCWAAKHYETGEPLPEHYYTSCWLHAII